MKGGVTSRAYYFHNRNRGEQNPNAKLTEVKVLQLKQWIAVGGWLDKVLAEAFGVSAKTVREIRLGRSWKHVS